MLVLPVFRPYSPVRFLLDALVTRRQSELRLQAEVIALRHQLRVLERRVRRSRWQPADRLLLTVLSRILPRSAWSGPGARQGHDRPITPPDRPRSAGPAGRDLPVGAR